MNDDASPSSPAPTNGDEHDGPDRDQTPLDPEESQATERRGSFSARGRGRRSKKKKNKTRNAGLVKKLEHVTHLLRTLDLLVFAELSALYYMECSMLRFLLRSLGQYMYLTPKHETFPFPMPVSRAHFWLIVLPNVTCMLLHLFASLPKGQDFHRGYQHGGVIIDFVGQKPPTWRLYYLLVDVAILAIQCLMLAVHAERERLRVALKTFRPLFPDATPESIPEQTIEALDVEERGLRPEEAGSITEEANGIELQPLRSAEEEGNRASSASSSEMPRTYLSDLMASGNAILGEYHLVHTIRSAAWDLERSAAHSLRTISYGATFAALRARRRGARMSTRDT